MSNTTTAPSPTDGSITDSLRRWFLAGSALAIPTIVTLFVVTFALNFLSNVLTPIVEAVNVVFADTPPAWFIQIASILSLIGVVLLMGMITESTSSERLASGFHTGMEAIPGVGTVYTSFRRMSDVLVESDTDSFQEVKLVEFPHEGAYSIAFVTAESIGAIEQAVDEPAMVTLFVPLAPNPVMGGFLTYAPRDRIYDVDMTVEEAVSALVTSGVTASEPDEEA
ncbi:hypothetical protein BRC86_11805 [Halobacteriales archaeon QS_3_64_16]|nr:MAG: hypothetical protein BRC86_11805 [Halobacteriales archaeon QS_3_64_16]